MPDSFCAQLLGKMQVDQKRMQVDMEEEGILLQDCCNPSCGEE